MEGFDSYCILDLDSPTLSSHLNFKSFFKHSQDSFDFLFNLFILSSALCCHVFSSSLTISFFVESEMIAISYHDGPVPILAQVPENAG